MRILVGWDDAPEAELISLYLNAGENDAVVVTETDRFLRTVSEDGAFDVVLMTTGSLTTV